MSEAIACNTQVASARTHNVARERYCILVITDNASNMAKAMLDASLVHVGCFAHSLQLAINDGLLSKRAVKDIIGMRKNIVGHFHTTIASHNMKNKNPRKA